MQKNLTMRSLAYAKMRPHIGPIYIFIWCYIYLYLYNYTGPVELNPNFER